MTVYKKRLRIVSFRVSEDEYAALQAISIASGAHSISDFARSVTCRFTKAEIGGGQQSHSDVIGMRRRLEELDLEVKRLALKVHA